MKKTCSVLLAIIFLASCASFQPMVDMRGKSQYQYNYDLRDCQEYANQVSPATTGLVGAGVGAGVGAVLGGIVGAFFGCPGETAAFGAAIGGASGGMRGVGSGAVSQQNIIRKCMEGRGWNVLN